MQGGNPHAPGTKSFQRNVHKSEGKHALLDGWCAIDLAVLLRRAYYPGEGVSTRIPHRADFEVRGGNLKGQKFGSYPFPSCDVGIIARWVL